MRTRNELYVIHPNCAVPPLFENSQLRHNCDPLVLGVGVHSNPIERRVGQIQKIRVLDEDLGHFLPCDNPR